MNVNSCSIKVNSCSVKVNSCTYKSQFMFPAPPMEESRGVAAPPVPSVGVAAHCH